MKKTMKRLLAMLLVVAMVAAVFAGCSNNTTTDPTTGSQPSETTPVSEEPTEGGEEADVLTPPTDPDDYDAWSEYYYLTVLGDFYEAYEGASDEVEDLGLRYAQMAIAEAKLLESAVMLPLTCDGGNYAISSVVPYTVTSTQWGTDDYRFHNLLVATTPITTEDRTALKELWAEVKGTGTYQEQATAYLEEHGYELKDTYSMAYTSDPTTWDILSSYRTIDAYPVVPTYDSLLEYDCENVQQYALATSYEVSDDGLTYTFHIREGVKWVDSQGREIADVTADDFVAGLQHLLDCQGGLEGLTFGIIKNAEEYVYGEVTDFNEVGVQAVDDHTLVYTLEAPCPFFLTMHSYSVFVPLCRSFYVAQGGGFGADFDKESASYLYGSDPDHIAYCGPYLITNATEKNTIVFNANPTYWNADNITIKTITWKFNDGSVATKNYDDIKAGVIDGAGLNASAVELAKQDGWFDQYAYTSLTGSSSYMAFYNIYRQAYVNTNDGVTAASPQSEEDRARTSTAMLNVHFRRALSFATDRASYNAQSVGEDLKLTSLRNSYIPGNFVSLPNEVTVDINGVATTFPEGTAYGEVLQAQLDADGVPILAYDVNADDGLGSGDGYDGWYNVDNAVAELEQAVAELAEEGVVVDADNPIYIDVPVAGNYTTYLNREYAYKQSIESALNGYVIVNVIECPTAQDWQFAGYNTTYGYEKNYDMYDLSGWGPDWGDPNTYLNTFLPYYDGSMANCIGVF